MFNVLQFTQMSHWFGRLHLIFCVLLLLCVRVTVIVTRIFSLNFTWLWILFFVLNNLWISLDVKSKRFTVLSEIRFKSFFFLQMSLYDQQTKCQDAVDIIWFVCIKLHAKNELAVSCHYDTHYPVFIIFFFANSSVSFKTQLKMIMKSTLNTLCSYPDI